MTPPTKARLRALLARPHAPSVGDVLRLGVISDQSLAKWCRRGWIAQVGVGEDATYFLTTEGLAALQS